MHRHALPSNGTSRPRLQPGRKVRFGASSVEFAVVAPILFLLMLAIFEFGRAFMVTGLLTDAARRGCRKGIIEGTTTAQIKSTATTYLQGVGISGDTATVTINDGVGNIIEAQNVPANTEITVTVQVPFNTVTWLPTNMAIYIPGVGNCKLGPTGNLSGQFTLRRE